MIYGYVRVSTKEQHIDRQMKSLIDFGVPEANIKVDKESGKDFDRPEYEILKRIVQSGDIIVVKEETKLAAYTDYMIIADKNTGVMYLVLIANKHLYSQGTTSITPLYNADGSLKIYED